MKKILLFSIFVLVLPIVYSQTLPQEAHTLLIEKIEVPQIIYPGDTFTLTLYVRKAWDEPIDDPYVYLEGRYPLLRVSPTSPTKLEPLTYEYDPWFRKFAKATYNITVEPDALAGSYTLYAVFSFTKYSPALGLHGARERFTEKVPITLTIKGKPMLEISTEGSKPQKIYPGDIAQVKFSISNLGNHIARNVIAYFSSPTNITVMWYSREIYVGNIPPNSRNFGTIVIDVPDDIRPGTYTIPARLTFESWDGRRHARYTNLKIKVENEASFDVSDVAIETLKSDTKDNIVSFLITNSGTKKAEDVRVILRASYPFTPTGGEYYVGDLEIGEETYIHFHVDVDSKASSQKYPVDLIVMWKEDEKEKNKVIHTSIQVKKEEKPTKLYATILGAVLIMMLGVKKVIKSRRKKNE